MGLISNKSSWFKKEVAPVQGGILTAASNIIFYGNLERWFKALNSETGEELWKFQISSGVVGNTFTYGHKGKQYVGVLSGVGSKWYVDTIIEPYRNGTDSMPPVSPQKNIVKRNNSREGGGALNIFSL